MKRLIKLIKNRKPSNGFYINGIYVSEYSAWQDSLERELQRAQHAYRIF